VVAAQGRNQTTDVVAIAVSGGGHRASAWALGVLQAVLDAGLGPSVTSVTSVSGGSITNGVVAKEIDLTTVDRAEFDRATAPLRDVIAERGLFFPGPRTKRFVAGVFACALLLLGITAAVLVALASRSSSLGAAAWWLLAGIVPLAAGLYVLMGRAGRGALKVLVAAAAVGALVAIAAFLAAWSTSGVSGGTRVVVLLAWIAGWLAVGWLLIRLVSKRGTVVAKALDAEFFSGTDLDAVTQPVDHIFATTDLETADSLYLAPRFIASYRRGVSSSAGVSLAQAVQASAALPVGFPPTVLKPQGPFKGAQRSDTAWENRAIAVSDGGAYDNMGDQWDVRRADRVEGWKEDGITPDGLGKQPNLLIVANASGAWVWEKWKGRSRLGTEIESIAKNQGIQYDQSTATRRGRLFSLFSEALKTGDGLRGVLIQIDRSPFQVIDFLPDADEVGETAHAAMVERAELAREALSGPQARERWDAVAKANAAVKTTLGPIGDEATNALMIHARTATLVYLFVLHGIGDPSAFDSPPS